MERLKYSNWHFWFLYKNFRIGSSGAPYFSYDEEKNIFKANASQSEASPIQLSIAGNKNGNFQYINAIASPLVIIQEELEKAIGNVEE